MADPRRLVRRRALQLLHSRRPAARGSRRRGIQRRLLGVPLRGAAPAGLGPGRLDRAGVPDRVHRRRPDRHRRSRAAFEKRCARLFRPQPHRPVASAADRALAAAVRTGLLIDMRTILAAAALAFWVTGAQALTLVDRIVAVVNKEVITYSELNEAVGMAERQLARQGTQSPERAGLERQMLERLILDKAQLQMARESGLRIDELQIDRAVERIAQSNKMTLSDFRKALEADGVAFDTFRADVRQQMVMARLREREVDNRVQVSESEVDLFLEQA